MVNLGTTIVNTTFNSNSSPATNSGSNYSVQIPTSSVMIPKPLSYEFRVVEHVENGQIVKVGLQYQVWEHDNYGSGSVKQTWTDVVRVQKDVATGAVTEL